MESQGIGAYIRERRMNAGWTQAELAEKTGLDRARIAQIEGGRVALPGVDHRRRLALALGVSNVDLLIAAHELDADELKAAGLVADVKRGPVTIADQIIECVKAINWEAFPGLATGILTTLTGIAEDQQKLRRRDSGR